MVAPQHIPPSEIVATADQRIILHNVPWSHYEILLAIRGDDPAPRMAYLEGALELMSPSRDHELIKSMIGRLLETYADEVGVDLWPIGSWTLRRAPRERGLEPDECYTIGDPRLKERPDLAIEVIWTSGGIDKLEIYRGLEIGEVWQWQDGVIRIHLLDGDGYREADRSALLPELDVQLLARLATAPPREALASLRDSLRRR